MDNNVLIGLGIVVLLVLMYTQMRSSETFLGLAASPIGDVPIDQSEPTGDWPMILFGDTQFRDERKLVRGYTEVIFAMASDNVVMDVYKSIKVLPGYQLVFRERLDPSENRYPKKVVAQPRFHVVEDIGAYLREDNALSDPNIFGYGLKYTDGKDREYTVEARKIA